MEGDPKQNEAPTNRLVLAQEDLDRIAAAIRDGLGKEPPDGKKLLWDIVRLLGAFALLVLVFLVLTNWRPAVDISVRADSLSTPQVLTHDPEEGAVNWGIGTGEVRALTVDALRPATESETEELMISLPIPRSECAEVAAELEAPCDDGVIEVQAGVTVVWSDPQVLRLDRTPAADPVTSGQDPVPQELKLDLQPSANPAGMARETTDEPADQSEAGAAASPLPELTIADHQAASQQWCFTYQTTGAATLSITGGSEGYERAFEPASAPDSDCDGLRLRVVPGAATASDGSQSGSSTADSGAEAGQAPDEPRRARSVVTLAGISSLDISTESRHLNASALAGSLTLLQDTRVLDGVAPTGITGERITSDLEIQSGTPSLAIGGSDVTGIETERGNLVSTVWQRHSDLALPIFIGVVGVFTPLLGTAYRNGVDYLANRRLPNRTAPPQRRAD